MVLPFPWPNGYGLFTLVVRGHFVVGLKTPQFPGKAAVTRTFMLREHSVARSRIPHPPARIHR
uniref:SH2 domain-containing protein n=1 Tax=Ascaris lumbricoides TaxID=6252 RepID=A0A0M3IRH6_ASCLU